ncbi:MAG: hypothetical protein EOP04_26220, partial [Proteobacteria bacterium]
MNLEFIVKRLGLAALATLATLSNSVAQESALASEISPKLTVAWACSLVFNEEPQVECNTLRNKFFDSTQNAFTESRDPGSADLRVQVTFQELPQHWHRFYLRITPSERFHADSLLLSEDVNATLDSQVVMHRLEKRLLAGIAAFREIESASVGEFGEITVQTPAIKDPDSPTTQSGMNKRFYVEAGGAGSGTSQGEIKTGNIAGTLTVDYFDRKNKFHFQVAPTFARASTTALFSNGTYTGRVDNPE